jgi:hypothetical protein
MGHLEIPNGSTYDGQFMKGLPNGVGVMRFTDCSRYEGKKRATHFNKNSSTVKLVYSDHPRDPKFVAVVYRWSLFRGKFEL